MKSNLSLYHTYRQRLARSALFKNLPDEMLDDMLSQFRLETWSKGTIRPGRLSTQRCFVILQGRMELLQIHPDTGKQLCILLLNEGDMYDVLSLLDGKQHDVTPCALDDLQLLSASLDTVRSWINTHPSFNKNFMPYLANRIREREELIADLGLFDSETRLARVILRHITPKDIGENASTSSIDVSLLHDLSNEKLGQMAGSARQVINRHLQAMKKEGILHSENHHLIIDDLSKLEQHAESLQSTYAA